MMTQRTGGRLTAIACFSTLAALSVGPAIAQDEASGSENGWDFSVAVYLWLADIGGKTRGGNEVEISFEDIVENLDGAFMAAFEARKGKWGLFTDQIYLDVGASRTIDVTLPIGPGIPVTTTASLDMQGWVAHFAGSYNLSTGAASRIDLVFGTRYLDMDLNIGLSLDALGQNMSRTIAVSDNIWDGIVGVKGAVDFGERWYLPYYADIGTGQSDSSWQASVGIGYRAARWVDVALVYRHLEWSFESAHVIDSLEFSGPTIGGIFRF